MPLISQSCFFLGTLFTLMVKLNLLKMELERAVNLSIKKINKNLISKSAGGSHGKESACNVGNLGSVPGLGRSPGEGNGNPLQYSCLENPIGRGAWWATVHVVTHSLT